MTAATVTINPPPLYCGEHTEHHAIVAIDVCGCVGAMSVIEHNEVGAYRSAAADAKDGFRIETWTVPQLRGADLLCSDHRETGGPPWWQSNHVKGKRRQHRPASWPPDPGFGL